MPKIHGVLVGVALVGFGACDRDEPGSLHRVEESRDRSAKPAVPAPQEPAPQQGVEGMGQPPHEQEPHAPDEREPVRGDNNDISGQGFGSYEGTISLRDDPGTTRTPPRRGTYSVIQAGGQPAGGARGGATGPTAGGGGVNAGGGTGDVNTGGAGGTNTGGPGGGNTGGVNRGGTGGGNPVATGGGLNNGPNTGAADGGGIRDTTAPESRSRPNNPDSFGTGRKYPDDSARVPQ